MASPGTGDFEAFDAAGEADRQPFSSGPWNRASASAGTTPV